MRAYASVPFEALSAGILAREGDPIAKNAVLALEDAQILPDPAHDYHKHVAHRLTEKEAEGYDLLVGLTREHAVALLIQFPALASRVCCLSTDIPDPFGGSPEEYRACLCAIEDGVRDLLFSDEKEARA